MAPKFTPAEMEAFIKLGQKLTERTVPLTEEVASRLAPHEQVALDEALMGGAKLGEVTGTGIDPRAEGHKPSQFGPATGILWGEPGRERQALPPPGGYDPISRWPAWEAGKQAEARQRLLPAPQDLTPNDSRVRSTELTQDAQASNREINNYGQPHPIQNPPVDWENRDAENGGLWPRSWRTGENIPAVAGIVGAGAALLGATNADAAGFTPLEDNAGDGFTSLEDAAAPAPQESGSVAQPRVNIPGQLTSENGTPAILMDPAEEFQRQAFEALGKFKKEHITPVIKATQTWLNAGYMGAGGGFQRRDNNPALAVNLETVLHPFIGNTEGNKGNQETGVFGEAPPIDSPLQRAAQQQAIDNLGPKLGPLYSAASAAFASGYAQLPFFMIPGLGAGPGGGLALGMLDEDVSPKAGMLMGAGGDLALKGLAKAGGAIKSELGKFAGAKQAARLSEFLPIAVLPPGAEGDLAAAIHAMPEHPFLPNGTPRAAANEAALKSIDAAQESSLSRLEKKEEARLAAQGGTRPDHPLVVAVDVGDDGLPKPRGLFLTPDGVHSATPPTSFKGKIVATERARTAAIADPTGPVAAALAPAESQTEQIMRAGNVTREDLPSYLADGLHLRDADEGSVLVLGPRGAALHDVADPKLQEKLARQADPTLGEQGARKLVMEQQAMADIAEETAAKQEADMGATQADIALGGNGNGDKLPPPPDMDPPPPPPPNPHNVDPLEEIRVRVSLHFREKGQGIDNWFAKKALHPTVYAPRDIADKAMVAASIDSFERLRDDAFKALVLQTPQISKAPIAKQRAVQQDLSRFVAGEGGMTFDKLKAAHPEIEAKSYELVQDYKAKIAENDKRLRSLGMLMDEKTLRQKLGQPKDSDLPAYATAMYYRFLMKKNEWFRTITRDKAKTARLINEIKRDVFGHEKYSNWSDAAKQTEATKYFEQLAGSEDALALIRDPKKGGTDYMADAEQSLRARKDLKPWEREVLGSVDNGFVRIAESVARQEQLILEGEMWKSVANNPSLATKGDNPVLAESMGHVRPLPMDPAKYGLAAGMRVSPETFYALVTAPAARKNAATVTGRFVNALKYGQTVANPGSWVTNFFANGQSTLLSGLGDPFTAPASFGRGMLAFAKDLEEHAKAPGLRNNVQRQRFMRAMELGIVNSAFSTAEFRRSATATGKAMQQHLDANPSKVLDILRWFPDMARRDKDALSAAYSGIDTFWKYSTYVAGLQKGGINTGGGMNVKKAIAFITDRYRPGMSNTAIREAVELEVARRIHYSFPMMDRVGEVVNKLGQAAGIANPYIKVKSELMRNYAQLPARMLNESGLPAHMMKIGLIAGGLTYALKAKREDAGISQLQLDKAYATAPRAMQRFKPGALALWYREASGEIASVDMTQMFEPLTWLQGDPAASMSSNFLGTMATVGVNGSPAEAPVMDLLANSGLIPPAFHSKPTPEWQKGGARLLGEAVAKLGPGIIRNGYNTAAKTEGNFAPPQVRGPTVPQLSPQTGMINQVLGPNRIQPIGSPEQATREIQALAGEINQAKRELADVGMMRPGQSYGNLSGPLDKPAAMKVAREVLDKKVARMNALQTLLRTPEDFTPLE